MPVRDADETAVRCVFAALATETPSLEPGELPIMAYGETNNQNRWYREKMRDRATDDELAQVATAVPEVEALLGRNAMQMLHVRNARGGEAMARHLAVQQIVSELERRRRHEAQQPVERGAGAAPRRESRRHATADAATARHQPKSKVWAYNPYDPDSFRRYEALSQEKKDELAARLENLGTAYGKMIAGLDETVEEDKKEIRRLRLQRTTRFSMLRREYGTARHRKVQDKAGGRGGGDSSHQGSDHPGEEQVPPRQPTREKQQVEPASAKSINVPRYSFSTR